MLLYRAAALQPHYVEDQRSAFIANAMGTKLFHMLTFSHELLQKLYNVPTPQMDLKFMDVPRESVLGKVLFEADYALKAICTSPDRRSRIGYKSI
ncbi:MAG: hypothetical protein HPY71_00540 [Firmicutes bacterium]|nr:hypothetical protein [Bacillota bacterium]